jgi:hypothetical protein
LLWKLLRWSQRKARLTYPSPDLVSFWVLLLWIYGGSWFVNTKCHMTNKHLRRIMHVVESMGLSPGGASIRIWPIAPALVHDVCIAIGQLTGRGNRYSQKTHYRSPCSPQIPQDLIWTRTRVPWWEATRRPTAWTMARHISSRYCLRKFGKDIYCFLRFGREDIWPEH